MDIQKLLNASSYSTQGVGAAGTVVNAPKIPFKGEPAEAQKQTKQTVGVNEAMNGQAVYTVGQAGIADGVAGKKLNLIA